MAEDSTVIIMQPTAEGEQCRQQQVIEGRTKALGGYYLPDCNCWVCGCAHEESCCPYPECDCECPDCLGLDCDCGGLDCTIM